MKTPTVNVKRCKECRKVKRYSDDLDSEYRVARRTPTKLFYRGMCKECEKISPPTQRLPKVDKTIQKTKVSYDSILAEMNILLKNNVIKLSPKAALSFYSNGNTFSGMNSELINFVLKAYHHLRINEYPYIMVVHPITKQVLKINGITNISNPNIKKLLNVQNAAVIVEHDEIVELRKELNTPLSPVMQQIADIEASRLLHKI